MPELPKDCGIDGLTFDEPSVCRIEFAVECDLRNIIHRFLKTGQLPDQRPPSGLTDVTNLPQDFQQLQDSALFIRQRFDMLPLEVRNQYNNDPLSWLDAESKRSQDTPTDTPKDTPKDTPTDTPKDTPTDTPKV